MRKLKVFLGFLLLLLLGPWIYIQLVPDRSGLIDPPAIPALPGGYRIYVADWGYHTSIILPQPAGLVRGPSNDSTATYVEFAWGDRRFYMQSNYLPHSLFATVFLPTESVIYLRGWARPPTVADGMRTLWSRLVTAAELAQLHGAVESTMQRDSSNARPAAFAPVDGYGGRFYPARGAYLFWNDCNWWTVDRLHLAGLAEGGGGVILSGQVGARLTGFRVE
ncbi:MAG: DUF2459 domain-containing protein [Gemmatimonadales bacterium]|nr:DUF2459 domain-containing protein [Gemmatimonadales bacterium]